MTRGLTRLAAGFAAALAASVAVLAGAAYGADDATIDHTELSKSGLQLLVTVPGESDVDLSSVKVTIDGKPTDATAALAASQDTVKRTTVLAIDTSGSMKGERIAAAKAAALTYLDTVPANVQIGIVTFANTVEVRQTPTLDRGALEKLITGLTLASNTALYEGVTAAINATGTDEGQHQVLVLSDGEDSTKATLLPVISKIKKSKVKVDAVALEQGSEAPAALQQMADAGGGTVIAADAATLEDTFSQEADALARQIAVTATVPADQQAKDATVEVSLDAGGATHSASGFFVVKQGSGAPGAAVDNSKIIPASSNSLDIPKPVVYGALGAIALGVLGLIGALLGSSKPDRRVSISEQLQVYSASAETSRVSRAQVQAAQAEPTSLSAQARAAAENVLASNSSFEARIADKLEGAGMALKASEWLLLHLGIAFVAAMFGLLITGGNPIAFLIFIFLGALGPWIYLGLKRSRRLKAFDSGLADTLQLMSGSLSAGLSLAQSLDTIVREGNEPITSEFKRVIVESRLGVPLEDALDGVSSRMQSKDFGWVVMAIRIQREVGGNLAELLNTVAATLREREYLRRHVQALSAEGRLSCWILGGLPPAFLGYLVLSKPDYVHPMFTTALGWIMLVGMAMLLTVGIFWMSKVAKVEI